ncbi:unnamed protein product [Caenorhabditis brenneri]
MQKRDCLTKVGSLQRKLRENHVTMKGLNSKLSSLEWAEQDANELVDELMEAKEKIKERDILIEVLQNQLRHYQSKERKETTCQYPILLKMLEGDDGDKENITVTNKPSF